MQGLSATVLWALHPNEQVRSLGTPRFGRDDVFCGEWTMSLKGEAPHLPSVGGLARREVKRKLCGAAASGSQFAHVVQEDGPLQGIEMRDVLGDLSQEGVVHQNGGLVAMTVIGVAQQGGDVHLEGAGQPVERRERRHCLAVLDLGDIGARNIHARGELALREIAHMAQIADCGCDLKTAFGCGLLGDKRDGRNRRRGLFNLKTLVAAAAKRVRCAELHQAAMVTAQDLTLFDGRHHGCHSCMLRAGPEQGPQHTSDNGACDVPRVTPGNWRVKRKLVEYG